jgi:hypothetical protein
MLKYPPIFHLAPAITYFCLIDLNETFIPQFCHISVIQIQIQLQSQLQINECQDDKIEGRYRRGTWIVIFKLKDQDRKKENERGYVIGDSQRRTDAEMWNRMSNITIERTITFTET